MSLDSDCRLLVQAFPSISGFGSPPPECTAISSSLNVPPKTSNNPAPTATSPSSAPPDGTGNGSGPSSASHLRGDGAASSSGTTGQTGASASSAGTMGAPASTTILGIGTSARNNGDNGQSPTVGVDQGPGSPGGSGQPPPGSSISVTAAVAMCVGVAIGVALLILGILVVRRRRRAKEGGGLKTVTVAESSGAGGRAQIAEAATGGGDPGPVEALHIRIVPSPIPAPLPAGAFHAAKPSSKDVPQIPSDRPTSPAASATNFPGDHHHNSTINTHLPAYSDVVAGAAMIVASNASVLGEAARPAPSSTSPLPVVGGIMVRGKADLRAPTRDSSLIKK
ncbi:hypothetical protein DFJ73DRAFT_914583 [Zopfochytrium polystomum]|nr:hypothetical protein DFJ73DRAFT_914583 [Zopfochytrium polystomum]